MKQFRLFNLKTCLIFVLLLPTSGAMATTSLTARPAVRQFIQRTAHKYGYSIRYIRRVLSKAHFNPDVIRRMNHPREAMPWNDYQRLFVTRARINGGVTYWNRSNKLLAWEEREYAVPSSLIVAIVGIESKYGKDMGNFNVLNTLTTLAFNYPTQKTFFQKELAAFILMTRTYQLRPASLYGSYAGAMGQCQFMPSSYLHYAVDFQGKNRPNLFKDKADVIFSVGNFLRQHGWEPESPIATRAHVSGEAWRAILTTGKRHPQKPVMTLTQLGRKGIYPVGYYNQRLKANLIELQGKNGPEYWLVFHNFYVITTYNASNLYAMAAFQLSQKIATAYHNQKKEKRPT